MTNDTWAVIPAKNEEKHISKVSSEAKTFCKVLVVDDGSSDKTAILAKKNGEVISNRNSLGKGGALRRGCDYAIKQGAKKIVVLDGDGQHNPKEISAFIEKLKNSDIVYGYRKFSKEMPFKFRFGNWFLTTYIFLMFGEKLKDTQCGYRAFTSSAYKKIRWKSKDYAMESEMIARAGKGKLKYAQIPVKTIYHDAQKGTTTFDGIKIAWKILCWRFKL